MAGFSGRIGHLEGVESPWSNTGGVIKTRRELELMARTGVGCLEDGSHVLGGKRLGNAVDPAHPELGAQRDVYDYNEQTGETANSLGMPGPGMDALEPEIPERVRIAERLHKKYILNVAPVSEDPAAEIYELVARGYAKGAHAVLVNGGCPNVVTADGSRHELLSRNPRTLGQSLLGLRPLAEKYHPVFLRLSPQQSFEHARAVYGAIRASGVVSAVFVPNTWPGFVPLDEGRPILQVPGGSGGKSGPATADASAEQTAWAVQLLEGSGIDVVRSGGIMNAGELDRSFSLGAVAGGGTTFYYEPVDGWADDTDRLIREWMALQ